MSVIAVESGEMRVEVDPAFGARVTALWDKRAGREWLLAGPREGDGGDGAAYGAREARGWDECFPTITPCDHPAWGGPLRDHGLLWGRPWQVHAHGPTVRATFAEPRFAFTRTLDLHGPTLWARYEVENRSGASLPWVWSQHAVLAARPGERIVLDGFEGFTDGHEALAWPRHAGRDLSVVGRLEDGWAAKLYARAGGASVRAALVGEEGGLAFEWAAADVPCLGLWLDWGGWPAEGPPVHQLALEPTTAPADDLPGAEAAGAGRVLAPGARDAWSVTVRLLGAP